MTGVLWVPQSSGVTALSVIRSNQYCDSVVLMRIAAALNELPGVRTASLVMGTEANREVLAAADLLTDEARTAGPNDLVVAVDGDEGAVQAALDRAAQLLDQRSVPSANDTGETSSARPRTLVRAADGANLALISTPGRYAAAEALKALRLGLHVFLFSDNVPLEQEVRLKRYAHRHGLLVMGPDCGTAIINGIPLGFANEVRRGEVGLIGASGTGLQQVSSLLDTWGVGMSQVIGVGSHDLSEEVGAISMLDALDALAADPATRVIGLISKPVAEPVAHRVLRRAAGVEKPVVVAFLGADVQELPEMGEGLVAVSTLEAAAGTVLQLATGTAAPSGSGHDALGLASCLAGRRRLLRALYAGGTFAHEAVSVLEAALGPIARSVDRYVPGTPPGLPGRHLVLDLGDDEFTVGRPHPMIDPTTRTEFIRAAAEDPETAVILLDVVLGHGAAPDPAGDIAPAIAEATAAPGGPLVVAFVVGTAADSQALAAQRRRLEDAGAVLAIGSTDAARLAGELLSTTTVGVAS